MGSPRLREVHDAVVAHRSARARPVVVLDLDSTLLHTGARHLRVLHHFVRRTAGREGLEWDALREAAAAIRAEEFGYEVTDPLRARGLVLPTVEPALLRHWRRFYFTSSACAVDRPAAGAVAFVQVTQAAGAFIVYLSGRPRAAMERGTRRNLRALGFPLGSAGSRLILKPDASRGDKEWKGSVVEELRGLGSVVAQFENEPGNANLLRRAFPEALHFLVGSICSPDAEAPDAALIRTEDFVIPEGA